jgi:hypothetical protein
VRERTDLHTVTPSDLSVMILACLAWQNRQQDLMTAIISTSKSTFTIHPFDSSPFFLVQLLLPCYSCRLASLASAGKVQDVARDIATPA